MRLVIVPVVTSVCAMRSAGGEHVGLAGPAQRGQHVELPAVEIVRGERIAACAVDVPGQPGHPAEHLERAHVEVGSLARPGGHQAVDLVLGARLGSGS